MINLSKIVTIIMILQTYVEKQSSLNKSLLVAPKRDFATLLLIMINRVFSLSRPRE